LSLFMCHNLPRINTTYTKLTLFDFKLIQQLYDTEAALSSVFLSRK
jgi:hypothetical protein